MILPHKSFPDEGQKDVTILFVGFPAVLWVNVHKLQDEGPACDDACATRQEVPADQAL